MDEKVLLAIIPALASLLGALIGGTGVLLANRSALQRELRKEHVVRIHNLAFDRLAPQLFEPLLQMYCYCQNQELLTGRPPDWDYARIQELLETKRFLVLVAPTPIKTVITRLEKHLVHPQPVERAQQVKQDLKSLEMAIHYAYGAYRLEGTAGEREP